MVKGSGMFLILEALIRDPGSHNPSLPLSEPNTTVQIISYRIRM